MIKSSTGILMQTKSKTKKPSAKKAAVNPKGAFTMNFGSKTALQKFKIQARRYGMSASSFVKTCIEDYTMRYQPLSEIDTTK